LLFTASLKRCPELKSIQAQVFRVYSRGDVPKQALCPAICLPDGSRGHTSSRLSRRSSSSRQRCLLTGSYQALWISEVACPIPVLVRASLCSSSDSSSVPCHKRSHEQFQPRILDLRPDRCSGGSTQDTPDACLVSNGKMELV
jgi:hypothetical protein